MPTITDEQRNLIATRARALGEPARIRMLEVLARDEQPVRRLAAAISRPQSAVSKHLQVLFHAGLVRRRREASAVIYSIADTAILATLEYLGRRVLSARKRQTTAPRMESQRGKQNSNRGAKEVERGGRARRP